MLMKKSLLFAATLLTASFSAMAYEPMLVEGRVWEYAIEDPVKPGEITYRSLRCGGKVNLRGDERSDKFARNCVCILNNETNDTLAYVRELEGVVYIVDSGGTPNPRTTTWYMNLNHSISMETLYDMTLEAGESYYEYVLRHSYLDYWKEYTDDNDIRHESLLNKIESTDTVLVAGKKAKRQTIYINNDGIMRRYHIIEGLGIVDSGDFIKVYRSPETDVDCCEMYLSKVTDPDGTVIYEYEKLHTKLIRTDRIWKYHRSNLSFTYPQCHSAYYCRFDGTQEVDGKTYTRLNRYMTEHWVEWAPDSVSESVYDPENHVMALMREDNGKVYLLPASVRNDIAFPESEFFPSGNRVKGCGETETNPEEPDYGSIPETLLYDFTVADGGSWEYCPDGQEHFTMELTGSTVTRINRENCRKLTVSQKEAEGGFVMGSGLRFVEGIGNIGEGTMTGGWAEPDVDCDNGFERFEAVLNEDESILYIAPKGASLVNSRYTWEYHCVDDYTTPVGESLNKVGFRGTVEIDGKTYHKFVRFNEIWWQYDHRELSVSPTESTEEKLIALIREEDGRLYARAQHNDYGIELICDEGVTGEYDALLCDFNAAVGTTFNGVGFSDGGTTGGHLMAGGWGDETKYKVSNSGYMNVNGRELKFVEITMEEYGMEVETYVESIGAIDGVLIRPVCYLIPGMNIHYEGLNGVYDAAGNKIFGEWRSSVPKVEGVADVMADGSLLTFENNILTATMNGALTLEVFNSVGTKVLSLSGTDIITCPATTLAKGIYVAKAGNGSHARSLKFIVR